MSYQIEFTLPFTKKAVVMTMPAWGVLEDVNREAEKRKLTPTESTAVLLSKIVTIDGKEAMDDDLKNLPAKDYMYIAEKWNDWEGDTKNG